MDADISQSFLFPQLNDGTYLLDESLPDFSLVATPRPPLRHRAVNTSFLEKHDLQTPYSKALVDLLNKSGATPKPTLQELLGRNGKTPAAGDQVPSCSNENVSTLSLDTTNGSMQETPKLDQSTANSNNVIMPESRKTRVTRARRGKADVPSDSASSTTFETHVTGARDTPSLSDSEHPTYTTEAILLSENSHIQLTGIKDRMHPRFPIAPPTTVRRSAATKGNSVNVAPNVFPLPNPNNVSLVYTTICSCLIHVCSGSKSTDFNHEKA